MLNILKHARAAARYLASQSDFARYSPEDKDEITRRVTTERVIRGDVARLEKEAEVLEALEKWYSKKYKKALSEAPAHLSEAAQIQHARATAQQALDEKYKSALKAEPTYFRYSVLKAYFEGSESVPIDKIHLLGYILAVEIAVAYYVEDFHREYVNVATEDGCRPLSGQAQILDAANRAIVKSADDEWEFWKPRPEAPSLSEEPRLALALPAVGGHRYLGDAEAHETILSARAIIVAQLLPVPVINFLKFYLEFLNVHKIEPIKAFLDLIYMTGYWQPNRR